MIEVCFFVFENVFQKKCIILKWVFKTMNKGEKVMIQTIQVKLVSMPMEQSIVETMQAGSNDTYVFCAPETIE